MKRVTGLVFVAAITAALCLSSVSAAAAKRTHRLAYVAEHSINLVLAGSPGEDRITIELSADGRSYEIEIDFHR